MFKIVQVNLNCNVVSVPVALEVPDMPATCAAELQRSLSAAGVTSPVNPVRVLKDRRDACIAMASAVTGACIVLYLYRSCGSMCLLLRNTYV